MQFIKVLFLINYSICAILLASGVLLNYLLFKALKKHHPAYYKSIGEPTATSYIHLTATEDEYTQALSQSLKGSIFAYSITFKGIPASFPKDIRLKRLAQAIRVVLAMFLILVASLIVVGYFFYKSTV